MHRQSADGRRPRFEADCVSSVDAVTATAAATAAQAATQAAGSGSGSGRTAQDSAGVGSAVLRAKIERFGVQVPQHVLWRFQRLID